MIDVDSPFMDAYILGVQKHTLRPGGGLEVASDRVPHLLALTLGWAPGSGVRV